MGELEVYINRQVPAVLSILRPALVVLNKSSKAAKIIDISNPFEGAPDALEVATESDWMHLSLVISRFS